MSSLPPPEHVTNLTSLIPQSLTKAAASMKSKASVPQSAHLTKPAVEPARTVMPVKQTFFAGSVKSRLSTLPAAAAGTNSVLDNSDEEGDSAADFFSLDVAAAKYPAELKSSEAADVRWSRLTSHAEPAATSPPPDIASAASADIVWNATNYTSAVTDRPPVFDTAMVRMA